MNPFASASTGASFLAKAAEKAPLSTSSTTASSSASTSTSTSTAKSALTLSISSLESPKTPRNPFATISPSHNPFMSIVGDKNEPYRTVSSAAASPASIDNRSALRDPTAAATSSSSASSSFSSAADSVTASAASYTANAAVAPKSFSFVPPKAATGGPSGFAQMASGTTGLAFGSGVCVSVSAVNGAAGGGNGLGAGLPGGLTGVLAGGLTGGLTGSKTHPSCASLTGGLTGGGSLMGAGGLTGGHAGSPRNDEDNDEGDDGEEDENITFDKTYQITAPGGTKLVTGEEGEECLLQLRAKLYRLSSKLSTPASPSLASAPSSSSSSSSLSSSSSARSLADPAEAGGDTDADTPAFAPAQAIDSLEWIEVGIGPVRVLRQLPEAGGLAAGGAPLRVRIVMRREESKGGHGTKLLLNTAIKPYTKVLHTPLILPLIRIQTSTSASDESSLKTFFSITRVPAPPRPHPGVKAGREGVAHHNPLHPRPL